MEKKELMKKILYINLILVFTISLSFAKKKSVVLVPDPYTIEDVKKLEVAPPGTAAIIITPTANSTGKFGYKLIKIKATIGKIIICENKPVNKSFG